MGIISQHGWLASGVHSALLIAWMISANPECHLPPSIVGIVASLWSLGIEQNFLYVLMTSGGEVYDSNCTVELKVWSNNYSIRGTV
jgi:hypothetical protein